MDLRAEIRGNVTELFSYNLSAFPYEGQIKSTLILADHRMSEVGSLLLKLPN